MNLGCFSAKALEFIVSDFRFKELIEGVSASVITNLDTIFFNGRLEVNTSISSNSLTLQSTFRPPIVQWRYASCQDSCLLGLKTLNDPRKNTQEQSKKNNKSRHFVDFQASSSFYKLTFYIIPETG